MDELIKFDNLREILNKFGVELVEQYKQNLIDNKRPATGDLGNTVKFNLKEKNNTYTITLNLQDYWYYVENGRKAGKFPPINKIIDWIKIKPVLPYPDRSGRLPTTEQLGFLISRKIAEEGTKGTNDLRKATDDIYSKFQLAIYEAINKDFEKAIIKIFKY